MSDLVKKANSYISFMRRGISDTFDNVSASFQTAYGKAMFALCLFTVWGVSEAAASGPTMTVDSYDYEDGSFQYVVTNTSPPDSVYEMNKFILPAGSNQGVYQAIGPDDWSFSINLDETIFTTNLSYIPPNGGRGFLNCIQLSLTLPKEIQLLIHCLRSRLILLVLMCQSTRRL